MKKSIVGMLLVGVGVLVTIGISVFVWMNIQSDVWGKLVGTGMVLILLLIGWLMAAIKWGK